MRTSPLLAPPQLNWRQRLERLRGSSVEYDTRPYAASLAKIHALTGELEKLSDPDLQKCSRQLAAEAKGGTTLDSLLPQAYALVGEAARRVADLRPFDVQVVAGVALHRGRVVEMQTGEGKTLAAVAPVYLNALTGEGVHVLTFNDYLAQRDAEWMGPIYRFLGLTVGYVREGRSTVERRAAYGCDVTYVTAKEAGFDHLRDLLCTEIGDLVHRPLHFALVDEADSILIDEARVPLVLAGSVERVALVDEDEGQESTARWAKLVERFEPDVHFIIEEHSRNVELIDAGFDLAEKELGCGSLVDEDNYDLFTELNCALHARFLLHRDVDYIVRGGKIEIVDELTGRVAEDRHWPDGLQAALEAKEGLKQRGDGRILGSITLEHFLGGYSRLSGMTGTARNAAKELQDLYGLSVVVIPTHRPMIRKDHGDVIFTHREAKEEALVLEIRQVQRTGRPLLVGTASVEESERLAQRLRGAGVPCEVLNAKNDVMEAEVIARAGVLGAVTISTNMAGRGVDIRLGGDDKAQHDAIVELGGLYVIGTNRHESLRVDLQLRGRAGRQGDPGESRFYVSLEDNLLERFDIRSLVPPQFLPEKRPEPILNPVVRREVARAQRIIEGENLDIRRALWCYATPVEDQRRLLQEERQALLLGQVPVLWQQEEPQRHAELALAVGAEAIARAETAVTLFYMDRAWSEHLAEIASLREGIHLLTLAGEDPLTSFQVRTAKAFHRMRSEIDDNVLKSLDSVAVGSQALDITGVEIKGPASTWTYLVNDDSFRHQLGRLLSGPGQATLGIGAALSAAPLFILWALVDRFYRKRSSRSLNG
jgi:preprotein translocase subunit SecA